MKDNLLTFRRYGEGNEEPMEIFRVTADRRFILAPDISAQDAAREFAAWVRIYLREPWER